MSLRKPILIHNDNTYLLKAFHERSWFTEKFSPSDNTDLDVQLSGFIDNFLINRDVSAIFIKINLSANYLEFVGLRLGIHIRLSRIYPDIQNLPIVFLGEESFEEITRIYGYSQILCGSGIYLVSEIRKDVNYYFDAIEQGTLKGCQSTEELIHSLKIEPPSNYETSHSIANEWSLLRYWSMLDADYSNEHYSKLENNLQELNYPKSLHFKYADSYSKRQKFKKGKNTISPRINGVNGMKIGVIDDEIDKGWLHFYNYIFIKSGADVVSFTDFSREHSKAELICKIQEWILSSLYSNNPIDIFVVDLRLHEDDFTETNYEDLSGLRIVRFIKNQNPGIQIIIATASNKVWNFQKCLSEGVKYFCVKESPSLNNSRSDTAISFNHFSRQLAEASSDVFLSKLYLIVNDLCLNNKFVNSRNNEELEFGRRVFEGGGLLKEVFTLLNINHNQLINNALLLCFNILENYAEMYSAFDSSWKVVDKGNSLVLNYIPTSPKTSFELNIGHFKDIMRNTDDKDKTIIGINFFDIPQSRSLNPRAKATKPSPLLKIALVLKYRDNIDENVINRLVKLRFVRNNSTAHSGNIKQGVKIAVEDIFFIMENVFQNIFIV